MCTCFESRRVYGRVRELTMNMCVDMQTGMCMGMCVDMQTGMCMGMCVYMCVQSAAVLMLESDLYDAAFRPYLCYIQVIFMLYLGHIYVIFR